jgi:exodeoxyribonuclease-5
VTKRRRDRAAGRRSRALDRPTISPELEAAALVQGGRERGPILHKLMEEVLTGETPEAEAP